MTTPAQRSNESPHLDKEVRLDDAALEALYSGLRDNAPGAPNRCVEVGGENAQAALLKKNILALVDSYDYAAAMTLAQSTPELFPASLLQALQAAKRRLMLETAQAIPDLPGCFEEERDDLQEGYEYILMLDTLVRREAYGDYARGISPALVSLLVLALWHYTEMNVYKLCTRRDPKAEWWIDPEAVRRYDTELFDYLNDAYRNGLKRNGLKRNGLISVPLNADVMLKMLQYYRQQGRQDIDTDAFSRLRKFEFCVRNRAAHQITPITEQHILDWTRDKKSNGMTPAQAQALLKRCFALVGGKDYHWDGYDKVNRRLAAHIDGVQ